MDGTKELLIKFIAKLHSMDEAAVSDLVLDQDGNAKPDALDMLTSRETERVKKLKGKSTDPKILADAIKAERDKVLSEVTEHVKSVLPDYSSEKEGLEFFDDLINIPKNPASKEVTEDDVKRSKAYRDMLAQKGDEVKKVRSEWETKFNQRESEIKKAQTMELVDVEAMKVFKSLNPVLPEDASKAERQIRKLYLDELRSQGLDFQVETTSDGKPKILLLKDGKPFENDLGHPIEFNDYAKGIAEGGFNFAVSDDKGAGGNPNGTGSNGTGSGNNQNNYSKRFSAYKLSKPVSDDEWIKKQNQIESDSELKPNEKTELVLKLQDLHLSQTT